MGSGTSTLQSTETKQEGHDASRTTATKASTSAAKTDKMVFDTRTPAQHRLAWIHFQRELPRSKSEEDKERRITLFAKFDVSRRGSLNVRETYNGCNNHLYLQDFTPRLPDIVDRAFNKAKDMGNKVENEGDEDKVEFLEFRLMLCYIYDYFKLTEIFDEMDTSGNMLITPNEFRVAAPAVKEYGLRVGDPDVTFRRIDTDGSGQITFDEFAAWAGGQKKEMDDEFGTNTASTSPMAQQGKPQAVPMTPGSPAHTQAAPTNYTTATRQTEWARIRALIPRKKTPEDKKRRIELFQQFDSDHSGSLTLSETYKGCVTILHLDDFTPHLKDITKRAFKKARTLGTTTEGAGDSKQVEFLEFRLMLCYIYDYFEITVMFDEIDPDGSGMLDRDELRAAVPRIEEWGVRIGDPDALFNQIDDNNSGKITFDEFAAWTTGAKLDADGDPDNVH